MLIGPAGETTVETDGPFGLTVSGSAPPPPRTGAAVLLSAAGVGAEGRRLGRAAAADRGRVVVVAGVGGDEVEGAGVVELVILRVRHGAGYDRVRVRGQVGDQPGAVVLGVERVAAAAARVRGGAG